MKKHLAIFSKEGIKQLFEGKKLIETRFSQKRIAPFGQVQVGDTVYIKPPGEEIVGQFKVKKVVSLEGLDEDDWKFIKDNFGKQMSLGSQAENERYLESHKNAKFATIIFIDQVEKFIASPIKVVKKDLRGWMVL